MRRLLVRRVLLAVLGRMNAGRLVIHEGDATHVLGAGDPPCAAVYVRSHSFWPMLLQGSRGVADAYCDGVWESPDLVAVFRVASRNVAPFDVLRGRWRLLRRPYLAARDHFARNTPTQSRKNVEAHYDIGNSLFSAMLDPTMTYSCAIFDHREASLHEASLRKLEMVCSKLQLAPEDHVVEIGTGWGGFAVYAATTRGCRITTTTNSREQHRLAVARIREAGVEHLVEVRSDDYRCLRGRYDKLVSLEMIEAVGHKEFGTFFACCSKLLVPDGLMLLQAITMSERAYEVSKTARSFVRTRVFPNGCVPSQRALTNSIARRTDMRILHQEDFTAHYVETLRCWRDNFEANAGSVAALGYDERFRRMWRLYLAYCQAGFEERRIGVIQMVLAKPQWVAQLSDGCAGD